MDDATRAKHATAAWESLLAGPARGRLEDELPRYLAGCRWFGGKARRVARIELIDAVPLERSRLLLLRVAYAEGDAEVYALPLELVSASEAEGVRSERAGAEVATVQVRGSPGVLFATDQEPAFARAVIGAIAQGRRFRGRAGEIVAW